MYVELEKNFKKKKKTIFKKKKKKLHRFLVYSG